MTTILAIDPGNNTGWALRYHDGSIESGTWTLMPAQLRKYEGGGMRYLRFTAALDSVTKMAAEEGKPIGAVYYEAVRYHKSVQAAHSYGGYTAHLMAWCEQNKIAYSILPVGSIKKFATGKGNANKEAMIVAANERWNTKITDDNEADARWIAELAASMS